MAARLGRGARAFAETNLDMGRYIGSYEQLIASLTGRPLGAAPAPRRRTRKPKSA